MIKLELMKRLYEIGAIKFGEFTLKSGKKSPYYIDLRILPSYPTVLMEVGKVMGEMITSLPEKPTRLCGIPTAGLAIATVVGIETGIPVCYTRKEPIVYKDLATQLRKSLSEEKTKLINAVKRQTHVNEYIESFSKGFERAIEKIDELSGLKTHGITRYVDGDIQNGDKIGIVDDLITTAESKLEARDLIKLEAKRRNINVDVIGVYVLLDREQGGKEALAKEGLKLYTVSTVTELIKQVYDLGMVDLERYKIIMNYIAAEKATIKI
jgi:uridine monophosphate synthetase